MGFGAPWWLLGLAAVPLVWWLHHWRAPLVRVPVSALFIWSGRAAATKAGSRQRTPDPAWRRRALLTAILALALARPWLAGEDAPITVWIDDSLSMVTSESSEPRLATGLRQLAAALDGTTASRVVLRSLSDPTGSMAYDAPGALDAANWLSGQPTAPDPPPSGLMRPDASHWLVSDGASATVAAWAGTAVFARAITVGEDTENVAIIRVAARRNVADPRRTDLIFSVFNAGLETATRQLRLQTESGSIPIAELVLAPAETRHAELTMDDRPGQVTAVLEPADALAADDALSLALQALAPVAVTVDAGCPASLRRAIDEHAGLVAASAAAELALECSDLPTSAEFVVRFRVGVPVPLRAEPAWLPAAGRLTNVPLRPGWLAVSAWPRDALDGAAKPLLLADALPLMVLHNTGPRIVDTVIDPGSAEFIAQPDYAAFIAGLIDLALDREVLDPVAVATREPGESRIAPSRLEASPRPAAASAAVTQNLTSALLTLALLVLAFDLVLVWRARAEARDA